MSKRKLLLRYQQEFEKVPPNNSQTDILHSEFIDFISKKSLNKNIKQYKFIAMQTFQSSNSKNINNIDKN